MKFFFTYVRKTQRSWTPEQLQAALDAVANELPETQAAIKFNIPRTTNQERKKNVSGSSMGRKPVF